MAQKAKNKTSVKRTLWPYEVNEDHKIELGQLGHLDPRDDGSYVLTVDRGAQEAQADKLIARLTADGVIGLTKVKPAPQLVRESRASQSTRRVQRQNSGAMRRGRPLPMPPKLAAAIELAMEMRLASITPADTFFSRASLGSIVVGYQLQEQDDSDKLFETLVELDLVGDAFWLFYKGTCFEGDEPTPIETLCQLIRSGDAAALAPKYIGA